MAAQTQHQVQLRRTDFQQQMGIPGQTRNQAFIVLTDFEDDWGGQILYTDNFAVTGVCGAL
ncbi:hypothetical protein A987_06622 [Pseudomonas syringae BRIP34881]|nr:hypothetical protein A987_06622 [Pseudomonas syringae BRIP34881]